MGVRLQAGAELTQAGRARRRSRERLQRLSEHEFREPADGERSAALDAVAGIMSEADLSDETLLRTDLDPAAPEREIRAVARR